MGSAFANTFSSWAANNQKYTGGSFDAYSTLSGNKKPGDAFGLFTPKPKEAVGAAPTVAAPEVMPDQQAIEAAKKKSIADQLSSRGRASTILTDQNDKLGG